jgi:DNA-binding CsgD family transcriptional regulator
VWILFVHSLYRKYYSKQKKKLLDKKQQEFSLSQLESEKEIMKLKNEKLQQEIDSKTRELSASTMSIIKKNEILNTIKNELSLVNEKDRIKPVIKIINKNLSNTGDWKLFEEAFNNADSDFLKKIKTVHPNLTPNDLRLCAYLRLNLSSKEIAPLLNISARSVEIKRYRLRKKMELDHEQSLVEYILKI